MTTVTQFPIETTPFEVAFQSLNFDLYRTLSTTSLAIGTGTKVFTVEEDKDFQEGDFAIAKSSANPTVDYMFGAVASYSGTTLTLTITAVGGSGTHADWDIRQSGPMGVGATGPAAWTAPASWLTATAYTVGPPASAVTEGGETYVCLVSHTSGVFATDLAAGKWIKVAQKGADGTGTGDVVGPASAVADSWVLFNNTTGKLVKDSAFGNWKVFYNNGSGAATALALGADKTILASNGASNAPSMRTAANLGLLEFGVTATISVGYTLTPNSLGNIASSFTPNPALGNYQYGNGNSAITWNAPANDCAIDILVTNTASAGSITFSGYTVASGNTGDALTTTNGHRFIISIRRLNSISTYLIKALQ